MSYRSNNSQNSRELRDAQRRSIRLPRRTHQSFQESPEDKEALSNSEMVIFNLPGTKFVVDRNQVCTAIPHLEKIFAEGVREVRIGNFDSDCFEALIDWTEDGRLPMDITVTIDKSGSRAVWSWNPLDLILLASTSDFAVTEVRDRCMDLYINALLIHDIYPDLESFEKVFENLNNPRLERLRRLFAEAFACSAMQGQFKDGEVRNYESKNPGLLTEVIDVLRECEEMGRRPCFSHAGYAACLYHSHEYADVCPWEGVDFSPIQSDDELEELGASDNGRENKEADMF